MIIYIYFCIQVLVSENIEARGSVSNENNILLDPEILTDHVTQVRERS